MIAVHCKYRLRIFTPIGRFSWSSSGLLDIVAGIFFLCCSPVCAVVRWTSFEMHASSNKGSDWWKSRCAQRECQRIIMLSYKRSWKILLRIGSVSDLATLGGCSSDLFLYTRCRKTTPEHCERCSLQVKVSAFFKLLQGRNHTFAVARRGKILLGGHVGGSGILLGRR